MSAKSVTVADACRMIADRTGDQQAAHILRQAGDELDRLTAELARHKPEQRVGRCGCDPDRGMGWEFGVAAWDNDVCQDYKDCEKSGCPRDNDGDGPQCSKADRHNPTWLYGPDPEWGMDAWGDRHPKFCPECGWELCKDGVARRNADTALLDALERLALESAEHGEAVEIDARAMQRLGVIGLSAWPKGSVVGDEWVGPDLRAAIRAALDQEVKAGE